MDLRNDWIMAKVPLLLPALAMSCGVALSGACAPIWGCVGRVWLWIAVAVVCLAALVLLSVRRNRAAVVALMFLLGAGVMTLDWPGEVCSRNGMPLVGREVLVSGEVVSVRDFGWQQRCVVRSGDVRIGVRLYDYKYTVATGDRVIFRGILRLPADRATVPDELDGSAYAIANRLWAVCSPRGGDFAIERFAEGYQGELNELRSRLSDVIEYSGLSVAASQFMRAVLLGENNVSAEVRETYAGAGLAHVMALSGMHVSTVVLMVSLLLLPLQLVGFRRVGLIVTLIALWAYALVTGMSPSVVRAVIMASMIVIGRLNWRTSNPVNSLSAAVILILLFSPVSLFRTGFQLSVLGVAGIVLFMPPVLQFVSHFPCGKSGWMRGAVSVFALPLTAVLVTAPLSAYCFHYFPAWFLVSNVPVSFLLPFFLGGGALMLISECMGLHCAWLVDGLTLIYDAMTGVAQFTCTLPGWEWASNIYFSAWMLPFFYLSLLFIWLAWRMRRGGWIIAGALSMAIFFGGITMLNPVYPDRECYAYADTLSSNVLWRDRGDVYILTDASSKHFGEISQRAQRRLVDYLGRRGAEIKGVVSDSLDLPGIRATSDLWFVNGRKIALVRDNGFRRDADIFLVTRRFKGDILEVSDVAGGCPLILSGAIYSDRRKQLAARLDSAARPYCHDFTTVMLTSGSVR